MTRMLTFKQLQAENQDWAASNFGAHRPAYWPLLGAVEKLGELAHAHLKEEQGIRGTAAEHEAAAKDAIADVTIYLADYCNRRGFDYQAIVEETWARVSTRDWKRDPVKGGRIVIKIYLAARYEDAFDMRAWRQQLALHDITVTSRWLDEQPDKPQVIAAWEDLRDIDCADALVFFNSLDKHGKGRGGRHVELGYALGIGKPILYVGQRENVFHHLPAIQFVDAADLVAALKDRVFLKGAALFRS